MASAHSFAATMVRRTSPFACRRRSVQLWCGSWRNLHYGCTARAANEHSLHGLRSKVLGSCPRGCIAGGIARRGGNLLARLFHRFNLGGRPGSDFYSQKFVSCRVDWIENVLASDSRIHDRNHDGAARNGDWPLGAVPASGIAIEKDGSVFVDAIAVWPRLNTGRDAFAGIGSSGDCHEVGGFDTNRQDRSVV